MTLAPKDAVALIKATRTANAVLIGGQAVAFWADYFGLHARLPALTVDIDFLGTRREAQIVDAHLQLPHRLKLAALDDLPNAALLVVDVPGYEEPVLVDYLASVAGLKSKEIVRSAVTVEVQGEPLRIIHPIQLLKSKLWNLYQFERKRSAEGVEQARLAIEIVAIFLGSAPIGQRQILRAIEAIGKFAATRPARFARERYGLECLHAVSDELLHGDRLPAAFRQKRWPRILASVE